MSLRPICSIASSKRAVRKRAGPQSGYGTPGFFQALARKLAGFLDMSPRVCGVSLQALFGRVQLHHDAGETLRQRIMDVPRETRAFGDNRVALLLLGRAADLEEPLQVARIQRHQPAGCEIDQIPERSSLSNWTSEPRTGA